MNKALLLRNKRLIKQHLTKQRIFEVTIKMIQKTQIK